MAMVALGSLFVVALQHVTGAVWSVPLRRAPERVAALTPWLIPLAFVALFSMPVVFSWTQPGASSVKALVEKSAWLNYPFFIIRLVICLLVWVISYRLLVGKSIRQDKTRDPKITVFLRRFSPLFMVLLALTITSFSFDWVSSIEAAWYSDIFGVYLFAGAALSGLAASSLAGIYLMRRDRLPHVTEDHLYNLGGLLFGFTIFWGYIAFSQYLLQWYANMPEEVFWYKQRTVGGMLIVFIILGIGHYFVPFLALMTEDAKKKWKRLRWVSVWLLFMEIVDLYWMIFPLLGKNMTLGWPELAFALFFICGGVLVAGRAMAKGHAGGRSLYRGRPGLPPVIGVW
ncbi:MAG: quinol:cytochrome C oxidoreductase [Acidobacteriota bacterium]